MIKFWVGFIIGLSCLSIQAGKQPGHQLGPGWLVIPKVSTAFSIGEHIRVQPNDVFIIYVGKHKLQVGSKKGAQIKLSRGHKYQTRILLNGKPYSSFDLLLKSDCATVLYFYTNYRNWIVRPCR